MLFWKSFLFMGCLSYFFFSFIAFLFDMVVVLFVMCHGVRAAFEGDGGMACCWSSPLCSV